MSTIISGGIFVLFVMGLYISLLRKNEKQKFKKALKKGKKNLIQNVLRLFIIFLIIGMLQNFLAPDKVGQFLLNFSGIKGVVAGLITGSIMMGPPASGYPIAQYLFQNNATVSLVTAFLLSWVMLGIMFITYEFQYLGKKFTLIRNTLAVISIIIISIIMEMII
ncbi:putative permease [Marinitoga piezophila KA3]|uniref:Putative permease n=1 Tax=Marinitoga piezophila (strain DSM 14283 / JCM 11233 / KA3) TaxID=443254 RepID=H2J2P6_MARPK|nr:MULTISPECIES: permease [Marinitoga]AEX84490.1 putative permease [Marinitoga piezophila KA3]